jgi:dTDP-4-dehydrorhamnose 3,5-epimerase
MIFSETILPGAFIIDVERLSDERGFFARTWCEDEFAAHGLAFSLVQASLSSNPTKGTLRGLHYLAAPHEETKLVRCTRGAIYDVIVDLREASPTFGQWLSVELTADNFRTLVVPSGCAHGFLTLAANTDVSYHMSARYVPGAERALRWNDPAFAIAWPAAPRLMSAKDRRHPDFPLPATPNHTSSLTSFLHRYENQPS